MVKPREKVIIRKLRDSDPVHLQIIGEYLPWFVIVVDSPLDLRLGYGRAFSSHAEALQWVRNRNG